MNIDLPPEQARRLVQRGTGHVHLAGICGIGMAGLAVLLRHRGFKVSGCDARPNHLADWLRAHDVVVYDGHDPRHLAGDVEWIIRSPAVSTDTPELFEAAKAGLPIARRGVVLPILLEGLVSVAVGGTHGKTTTTSFVVQLLRTGGHDPSFCIGGEVPALGGVAATGRDPMIAVEADESDGTLALYSPDVAVITNIEFDHMEHFGSVEEFENVFHRFAVQARRVIYCGDDPRAARIGKAAANGLSYGLGEGCHLQAVDVKFKPDSSRFGLMRDGRLCCDVHLSTPGVHNVRNALAAIAVGLELGVDLGRLCEGLKTLQLPRRRFECVVKSSSFAVITDYAHHPTEIAALVRSARRLGYKRIRAVFQPHRFTRTKALGPEFSPAFEGVDEIIITPVYAASEPRIKGGTEWDLYAEFRRRSDCNAMLAASLEEAWRYWKATPAQSDLFLVVGAGDVEKIAGWTRQEFAGRGAAAHDSSAALHRVMETLDLHATILRTRQSLAGRTTLRVGGDADIWAEVGGAEDLATILRWTTATDTPFRLMGGGSNLLVSDLGARGIVARLTGIEFRHIEERDGEVVAGAAVSLHNLLQWSARHGRTGLEFLEGIPGTLGGALRMNAGAWGGVIGESVVWVRGIQGNGTLVEMPRAQLVFGYRSCPELARLCIVEAALRLPAGDPDRARAQRDDFAGRRAWMQGLRSAGSVFKNPPGDFAGRLIESAGLKGMTIGGASISARHANVIVTTRGARASDVRALMELTRLAVQEHSGVLLEPEIVCWD